MDVLIVERDPLLAATLADTLTEDGIDAAIVTDEMALALPSEAEPRVVVTGMNRSPQEDMKGLGVVAAMRQKWPALCAIYLAALWPAQLRRSALAERERFIEKPARPSQIIRTVRQLLDSGFCRQ